ncbi:MAG: HNH endonuclease [Clostridia bacterium]
MKHYKESEPFYHSQPWRRVRAKALERDCGMCCDCMARFRAGMMIKPRRADMVHHIIPREVRPDLELTLSNLRSLCNPCHNGHHPEKGSGRQEAPRTRMRVIKV